jgi:drug/metabolite transporter (DMT)-like permease
MLADVGWLCFLAVLWGSSYTLIKVAVETIPPFTLVAGRVGIAALILGGVAWWRELAYPRQVGDWRILVLQAALLNAVPFSLISWGEQYLDSGLTAILNATPPLFVFALTWLWTRHEPATPRRLVGVLLGLGGVTLIIGTNALAGLGHRMLAELAVVMASVCYALAAINGRRLHHLAPLVTATGTMVCAFLLMAPLSLVADRPWLLAPSTTSVLAALVLAVCSTALATFVYFRLLATIGSIGTTSNSYLRAVVSVLLGVVLLGEQPTWQMIAGLGLVVGAVTVVNSRPRIDKTSDELAGRP